MSRASGAVERCSAPTHYVINESNPRIEIEKKAKGWKITQPITVPKTLKGWWLREDLLRNAIDKYITFRNIDNLDRKVHGRAAARAPTTEKEAKEQEELRKARERSLKRTKKRISEGVRKAQDAKRSSKKDS